jgi:hypothetical protein
MKQPRLFLLLAVMGALVVLRLVVPPSDEADGDSRELVAAVDRPRNTAIPVPEATSAEPSSRPIEIRDIAGNAFAVRVVRQPPPPPPPPPAPKVAAFVGPPEPEPPPPPPRPPIQVIGTWDDSAAPGVFVSTTQGTVLARAGTVLLAEYRVTAISAQQVSLTHVTTKYVWQLPIPRATANR